MNFKYELHCHTSETSRCSNTTGEELVRKYKELGFTGIFITDHFFNGNTTVPRDLPWEERINLFCRGYDNAYKTGQEIGLDVFFAWEYSYHGSDFLTYGLDKEWLLSNPDVERWNPKEYFARVHADGAFIVHAHPFRVQEYILCIHLFPDKIDAVEVINTSMPDDVNGRADWMADSYNLIKVGGSDTHWFKKEKPLCRMIYNKRLCDVRDFIETTKLGDYTFEKFNIELD